MRYSDKLWTSVGYIGVQWTTVKALIFLFELVFSAAETINGMGEDIDVLKKELMEQKNTTDALGDCKGTFSGCYVGVV